VYGGGTADAFLTKFDGNGQRLWSTFYGGTGADYAKACMTDASGNVYLSGYTLSPNAMASPGSFQSVFGGGNNDGFLVQFNSGGVRQWGTYYGDVNGDIIYNCTVDGAGNCYILGSSSSPNNIATAGSYQSTYGGGNNDAFVASFASSGNRQWATYYGGTSDDRAYWASTDLSGNIYFAGSTSSPNGISSVSAWQTSYGGAPSDAFIAKFKDCSISASPASQTNNLCFGGSIGTAEVAVAGGSGGTTFDWMPGNPAGDGTAVVTGLTAGTYTVTVTDNSGCYTTQTFTITDPPQLITTITASGILCNGGTTVVTVIGVGGTAPYSGEGTFNVGAGLQLFTLTDLNGCSATTSYTFTEPPALVVTTSSSAIMCHGDTSFIFVSATGGVGGYNGIGSFPVIAGTYVYTVTDANGCADTSSITVTQPTAVSVIPTGQDIACTGGTTVLNITGANGIAPYFGEGTFTVSAGTYTFTITDSDGCIGTLSFTVTEPSPLIASAMSTPIFCHGETAAVTVTATGGTPAYSNTGTFTQNAGTYSYIVSDTNGCADTTTITLTEPTPLVAAATSTAILCNGGTADITVTGSGGTPGYVNDGTFTQNAGTYTFYISDENGCEDSVNITVTEPAALVATIVTAADPTTCGGTDGAIDISVSGGTPGYSYLWNTTANTEDISTLGSGVYSCAATDTNGCTMTTTVTLTDPNPPTVNLAIGVDTVCNLDGTFVLIGGSPAGGTYAGSGVNGGSFDPANANAGANIITYTYTDAQTGCSASNTDIIVVDACTGVSENLVADAFSIYPNPNNGNFLLQLNTTQAATIFIYDAIGQLVQTKKILPHVQQQISIESAGVYLISIVTADGQRSSQRVVVNQ
jgi:Secretion system C-terminal sorting domain/SprB repeat